MKIRSDVDLKEFSATLRGYLYKPDGEGPFPAVILLHGCSGLEGGVGPGLQNLASYLNRNGFAALILDSFSTREKPGETVCTSPHELAAARYYRVYDAYSALYLLKKQPFVDGNNVFLVGQSNGGSVALIVAGDTTQYNFPHDLHFQAIVAYYPWCEVLPSRLVSPVLVFGAGRDDWVKPEECEDRKDSVNGESMEVVIYPDVYHSFDLPISIQNYVGHVVGGNQSATDDSHRRMVEFFRKHMK